MREFKFRAWDKINNDVKEVALLSFVDRGVLLWTNGKQVRATVERDMSDVEPLQNTNFIAENISPSRLLKSPSFDGKMTEIILN